ncbi:MAG: hypothetical protein K2X93_24465 [Candidatus Obscuribacterales bacterium]|nr:hypothetical protein [Candidatus Obscuribacterales bacterium]
MSRSEGEQFKPDTRIREEMAMTLREASAWHAANSESMKRKERRFIEHRSRK